METIPYQIKRYFKAENVIRAYSINVTPAERDFFGRFNFFSSTRRKLISEASAIIDQDEEFNAKERALAMDSFNKDDQEVFELMDAVGYGSTSKATIVRRKAFFYSNSTLRLIIERFGAGRFHGVIDWLDQYSVTEAIVRESLVFHDVLKDLEVDVAAIHVLNTARENGFPFEDMSELADEDAVLAAAVMTVARELLLANNPSSSTGMMEPCMSHDLARVTVDYPERALDIAEYITSRGLTPDNFGVDALREYCSNPTRSLNSGVL